MKGWKQVTWDKCLKWQIDNELSEAMRILGNNIEMVRCIEGEFQYRNVNEEWTDDPCALDYPGDIRYIYYLPDVHALTEKETLLDAVKVQSCTGDKKCKHGDQIGCLEFKILEKFLLRITDKEFKTILERDIGRQF